MAETHRGTCFCGAVEIEVTGQPLEMGYCHCTSCRTYSGAPLVAYILYKAEDVKATRGAELIGRFMKTRMSDRQHCTRCGGHLITGHPNFGLTDVRPTVLPGVAFRPTVHLHYAERVLPVSPPSYASSSLSAPSSSPSVGRSPGRRRIGPAVPLTAASRP